MESLQIHQTQLFQVLVITPPFRNPKGPLTAPIQVLDQPTANKPVYGSHRLARIAKGEIIGPPPQVSIDRFYQVRQRHMTLPLTEHPSKRFPLCLQRLLRRGYIQIPKAPALKVPVIPKREAKKVHHGSRLAQVYDFRLIPVQLQAKPGLDLCLDKITQLSPLVSGKHRKIIRIADDPRLSPISRPTGSIEDLLEPVKVHIRQKRRNNSALGSALFPPSDPRSTTAVSLHDRRLKPHSYQLQHRPIRNTHLQAFQQLIVRNRVKVPLQVCIVDSLQSPFEMLAHLSKGTVGRSFGPKPVRAVHEVRFKDGFNDQQHCRLYHPVPNGRYAQRAFTSVRLGYPRPAHRRWPVPLGSQALLDFIHKTLDTSRAALNIIKSNPVDPGLTLVRPSNPIGTAQHIPPIDSIIQRIESKLRLQLRLTVKLLSQGGEFHRQVEFLDRGTLPHVSRSPHRQLFRSRTFVQAAHSLSYSACPQQGPFAPSCFQDFLATMGLSDSRMQQISRLFIPGHPPAFPPSRSGSPRFLGASFRKRPPLSPRSAPQVRIPVSSLQVSGFAQSGRLATPTLCNEAETGSLSLGLMRSRFRGINPFATRVTPDHRSASHGWLPSRRGPPLHGEQAITMADTSQSARHTRLILAHQTHTDKSRQRKVIIDRIYRIRGIHKPEERRR